MPEVPSHNPDESESGGAGESLEAMLARLSEEREAEERNQEELRLQDEKKVHEAQARQALIAQQEAAFAATFPATSARSQELQRSSNDEVERYRLIDFGERRRAELAAFIEDSTRFSGAGLSKAREEYGKAKKDVDEKYRRFLELSKQTENDFPKNSFWERYATAPEIVDLKQKLEEQDRVEQAYETELANFMQKVREKFPNIDFNFGDDEDVLTRVAKIRPALVAELGIVEKEIQDTKDQTVTGKVEKVRRTVGERHKQRWGKGAVEHRFDTYAVLVDEKDVAEAKSYGEEGSELVKGAIIEFHNAAVDAELAEKRKKEGLKFKISFAEPGWGQPRITEKTYPVETLSRDLAEISRWCEEGRELADAAVSRYLTKLEEFSRAINGLAREGKEGPKTAREIKAKIDWESPDRYGFGRGNAELGEMIMQALLQSIWEGVTHNNAGFGIGAMERWQKYIGKEVYGLRDFAQKAVENARDISQNLHGRSAIADIEGRLDQLPNFKLFAEYVNQLIGMMDEMLAQVRDAFAQGAVGPINGWLDRGYIRVSGMRRDEKLTDADETGRPKLHNSTQELVQNLGKGTIQDHRAPDSLGGISARVAEIDKGLNKEAEETKAKLAARVEADWAYQELKRVGEERTQLDGRDVSKADFAAEYRRINREKPLVRKAMVELGYLKQEAAVIPRPPEKPGEETLRITSSSDGEGYNFYLPDLNYALGDLKKQIQGLENEIGQEADERNRRGATGLHKYIKDSQADIDRTTVNFVKRGAFAREKAAFEAMLTTKQGELKAAQESKRATETRIENLRSHLRDATAGIQIPAELLNQDLPISEFITKFGAHLEKINDTVWTSEQTKMAEDYGKLQRAEETARRKYEGLSGNKIRRH